MSTPLSALPQVQAPFRTEDSPKRKGMYLELDFYATSGRLPGVIRTVCFDLDARVIYEMTRHEQPDAKKAKPQKTRKPTPGEAEDDVIGGYEPGFFEALAANSDDSVDSECSYDDEGNLLPPYLSTRALKNPRGAADLFFTYHRISTLSRDEAMRIVTALPAKTREQRQLQREVGRRIDELSDDAFDEVFDVEQASEDYAALVPEAHREKHAGANGGDDDDDDEISSDIEDFNALMQRPVSPRMTRGGAMALAPRSPPKYASDDDFNEVSSEGIDSDAEAVDLELDDSIFDEDEDEDVPATIPAEPSPSPPPAARPVAPAAPQRPRPPSPVLHKKEEEEEKASNYAAGSALPTNDESPNPADPTWRARSRCGDYKQLLWMSGKTRERLLFIKLKHLQKMLEPVAAPVKALTDLRQRVLTNTYELIDSLGRVRAVNIHVDRAQLQTRGGRRERLIMFGMFPLVLAMLPTKLRRTLYVSTLHLRLHEFYLRHVEGDARTKSLYEASIQQFIHNANYIWDLDMTMPPPSKEATPAPTLISKELAKSAPLGPPRSPPPSPPRSPPRKPEVAVATHPQRQAAQAAKASREQLPSIANSSMMQYRMELQRVDQVLAHENNVLRNLQEVADRTRANMQNIYYYRTQLFQKLSQLMPSKPDAQANVPFPRVAPQSEVIVLDDDDATSASKKRARPDEAALHSSPMSTSSTQPSPSKRARLSTPPAATTKQFTFTDMSIRPAAQ